MCGIAGIIASNYQEHTINAMLARQNHRGPDAQGVYKSDGCILGHNRLSIIDLSSDANQPMKDASGRYAIVFNGEIYNYKELRTELDLYPFKSQSDTEVLLAAFLKWNVNCLEKLIGMFSFAIWDSKEKTLFAARDRFGVKPFYYTKGKDSFCFASEIKTLWAGGAEKETAPVVWSSYLAYGSYGTQDDTFWKGVKQLPAGAYLTYSVSRGSSIKQWYNFSERIEALPVLEIVDRMPYYEALLKDAVSLRFRADVPVGFNLSGGLDSSTLLAIVDQGGHAVSNINAFTFTTGNPAYDELPWVEKLLQNTAHPLINCCLNVSDIPSLSALVSMNQDEPFGGIPTLAYSAIFKKAREEGVLVLLDGQGMDEAWAGYDYYMRQSDSVVQGTLSSPVRPECLDPDFLKLSAKPAYPELFSDRVQNLQYRDLFYTKIPRALRFNDRISMMYSTELREPFLDHRLVEFAFSQPIDFKIKQGNQKWMLRQIASKHITDDLTLAPKRPVQTPQREWLANELKDWADSKIKLFAESSWVDRNKVLHEWNTYLNGVSDNSFYIWQYINTALLIN